MQEYLKALVLFEGTASEKIAEYIGDTIDTYSYFDNMQSAVDKAYEIAETGDMVILCPGGSSFNMFANEFDRGDQFIEAVEQLN
jgi:UDP-N-acetylmuramoylalanine--D-glutamate ligase